MASLQKNIHDFLKATLKDFYQKTPLYHGDDRGVFVYDTSRYSCLPCPTTTPNKYVMSDTVYPYWGDGMPFDEFHHYMPTRINSSMNIYNMHLADGGGQLDPEAWDIETKIDTMFLDSKRHPIGSDYIKIQYPSYYSNGTKMFSVGYVVYRIDETLNSNHYNGVVILPFLGVRYNPYLLLKDFNGPMNGGNPYRFRLCDFCADVYAFDDKKFLNLLMSEVTNKFPNVARQFLDDTTLYKYICDRYGWNGVTASDIHLNNDTSININGEWRLTVYDKEFFDNDTYSSANNFNDLYSGTKPSWWQDNWHHASRVEKYNHLGGSNDDYIVKLHLEDKSKYKRYSHITLEHIAVNDDFPQPMIGNTKDSTYSYVQDIETGETVKIYHHNFHKYKYNNVCFCFIQDRCIDDATFNYDDFQKCLKDIAHQYLTNNSFFGYPIPNEEPKYQQFSRISSSRIGNISTTVGGYVAGIPEIADSGEEVEVSFTICHKGQSVPSGEYAITNILPQNHPDAGMSFYAIKIPADTTYICGSASDEQYSLKTYVLETTTVNNSTVTYTRAIQNYSDSDFMLDIRNINNGNLYMITLGRWSDTSSPGYPVAQPSIWFLSI